MSTPNFKDGQPLPVDDYNINVIGGLDSAGNVQALTLEPDGGLTLGHVASSTTIDATGLNNAAVIDVGGYSTIAYTIGGTWTGTLQPEVSADGVTWLASARMAEAAASTNGVTTTSGTYRSPVGGYAYFRMRVSVAGTGTVALAYSLSQTPGTVQVAYVGGVFPGSTATALGKNEDNPHTASDTGVFILGVRNSALGTLTSADGDYSPIAVNLAGGPLVDVQWNNQQSTALGILKKEDDAHASGDAGVAIFGVYKATHTNLVGTDGDYTCPQFDGSGSLRVAISRSGFSIDPMRAEDEAFGSGETVMMAGAQREDFPTASTSASLDVSSLKTDNRGALWVNPAGNSASNITSATTTVVKASAGILKRIVVNKAVASAVITIYDNTAASGTLKGTITMPAALLANQFELNYDCICGTGITVVTSAATDITVIYQ